MASSPASAVAIACVALSAIAALSATASAQTNPDNTFSDITIDYAVDAGPSEHVASGYLLGLDALHPAQYIIDGVDVKWLRGPDYHPLLPSFYEPATYERAKATGAEIFIDVWFYVDFDVPYRPGDNGDWTTWEWIVTRVVNESLGRDLDIAGWVTWNEPRLVWDDIDLYMEAHCRAQKVIKRILGPEARVLAPEDHAYSLEFMRDFLFYARENDCVPDILAWHELSEGPLDVEAHAREIHGWMIDNGFDPPLDLAVPEYQGITYATDDTSIPGINVFYLASMERAAKYGFKYGLHACWTRFGLDPDFFPTLADLADRDEGLFTRGMWWNYNAYRDMTGRKIEVTVAGENGDSFASVDASKRESIALIGTRNRETPHDVVVNLVNIPEYLKTDSTVHVQVDLVINAMILLELETVIDADFPVAGDAVTVPLPTMIPDSAYIVRVTPVTSSAKRATFNAADSALKTALPEGTRVEVVRDMAVFHAKEAGDFVEYTFPLAAGTYHVYANVASGPDLGLTMLYVDGQSVGGPVDLYGDDPLKRRESPKRLGVITVDDDAESVTLKFVAVDKNPKSAGFKLAFDSFTFFSV